MLLELYSVAYTDGKKLEKRKMGKRKNRKVERLRRKVSLTV